MQNSEDKLFYSPMNKNNPEKILFLCIGNTCRSIIAEGLLSSKGKGSYEIYSAGIISKCEPISLFAKQVLEEEGMSALKEKSCHIEEYKDIRFDKIIILDKIIENKGGMRSNFTFLRHVEDPYTLSLEHYREAKNSIEKILIELELI